MKVLITGGVGYIGSTVATACAAAGHAPVLLDDLSTGRAEFARGFPFYRGDVGDSSLLRRIVDEHSDLAAVVHCAAKIVVPESVAQPLSYYDTNVAKTIQLLRFLDSAGIRRLVFSSSAAIYAPTERFYVTEDSPVLPQSPYAATKLVVEQILAAAAAASDLRAVALRYFNPVGADPLLRTGQQLAQPSHLLGRILSAYQAGARVTVFGTDWPTRDGTAIRDYIHVWDLARAHVAAIERIDELTATEPSRRLNIGTGVGTTVRELIDAFQSVTGFDLAVVEGPRRAGDAVGTIARTDLARSLLDWTAELDERAFVEDSLRWLRRRPEVLGY